PDEWIVAAGVEDNEPQASCRFKHLVDTIERNGLVACIDVPFEHRVNWDHVVCATDLDPVTGVENNGYVRITCRVGEISECTPHCHDAQVIGTHHRIETGGSEHRLHCRRVVLRVVEAWDLGIRAVPNNQRNALFGVHHRRAEHKQKEDGYPHHL